MLCEPNVMPYSPVAALEAGLRLVAAGHACGVLTLECRPTAADLVILRQCRVAYVIYFYLLYSMYIYKYILFDNKHIFCDDKSDSNTVS